MARAKKTTIDKLADAVAGIINEYADDVEGNVDLITKGIGQKGATAMRQMSRQKFKQHTGEYAKGWKYAFRKTRRYAKTIIYNDHYSMPHLLENGHVIRNGTGRTYGRVEGREHIKPVADELKATYEREVIDKL